MTKKEKFNNFIENAALKTGDVNIESMLKNHKENLKKGHWKTINYLIDNPKYTADILDILTKVICLVRKSPKHLVVPHYH